MLIVIYLHLVWKNSQNKSLRWVLELVQLKLLYTGMVPRYEIDPMCVIDHADVNTSEPCIDYYILFSIMCVKGNILYVY